LIDRIYVLQHVSLTLKFSNFYNKKFELMLTRRAKAYSSSCSQIALVYISSHFVAIHSWSVRRKFYTQRVLVYL